MIEKDTIRLLRECDAGIQMGISAIQDVLGYVHDEKLKGILVDSRDEHDRLNDQVQDALYRFHDEGKEPSQMAKGMSHIMTGIKMTAGGSDSTVADLITDGCNSGIKSLHRYLNQYKAADEDSKNITKRLVSIEERLAADMRKYL